jgi:hypothetical protein
MLAAALPGSCEAVRGEDLLSLIGALPLLLGLLLVVGDKLDKFINKFIGLLNIDVIELDLLIFLFHLIIIRKLEKLIFQLYIRL